ncbi:MAG: glycosyltransferase [Chloroflexota bacterium]
MQKPHNILILSTTTGNGHQASAQALAAGFEQRFGNQVDVTIVDSLRDHTPFPVNLLPLFYNTVTTYCPWLWQIVWDLSLFSWFRDGLQWFVNATAMRSTQKMITDHQPDLIITVHQLFVHQLAINALRRLDYKIPFVTVTVDLIDTHSLWFHHEVDLCFVCTDMTYECARAAGMTREQLRMYGLPIRPSFTRTISSNISKSDLRQRLGLNPGLPAVLMLGGRTNNNKVIHIAQAISQKLAVTNVMGQLVIICETDSQLHTKLMAYTWPTPTTIVGFVENMDEWMLASDCVVTKSGSVALAEAMACGVPMIPYRYMPGHQASNPSFVVENGMGIYSQDADEIAQSIVGWFGQDAAQLKHMATQAKQHGRPDATSHIVDDIGPLIPTLKHRETLD